MADYAETELRFQYQLFIVNVEKCHLQSQFMLLGIITSVTISEMADQFSKCPTNIHSLGQLFVLVKGKCCSDHCYNKLLCPNYTHS